MVLLYTINTCKAFNIGLAPCHVLPRMSKTRLNPRSRSWSLKINKNQLS